MAKSLHASVQGLALIQRFEGFQSSVYKDAAGLPTIGYGHLILPSEREYFCGGINSGEALTLLQQDIQTAEHAVNRLITVPLSQNQFDALVSFTFNLGTGVLQRSTLRRVINREEHEGAPHQFKRTYGRESADYRDLLLGVRQKRNFMRLRLSIRFGHNFIELSQN